MIRLDRRYLGKNNHWIYKQEVVYTQEEADKEGLSYVYWKDAAKGDKWALTDDGYVSKILTIKMYNDRKQKGKNKYVKLTAGVGFNRKYCKMNFLKNHSRNEYSTMSNKTSEERELARRRAKDFIYALACMKLTGRVNWAKLGRMYRPDSKIPVWTAKRFAQRKKVAKMVNEELKKLLTLQGITDEWVAVKLKLAAKMSEDNKDPSTLLRVVDKVGKYLGFDQRETQTNEIEGEMVEKLEGDIEKSKKLRLKQTTEKE